MSAPCPLAVMDAIAHSVEQALVPGNDYRRELRAVQQALPEARAAVAELVEAAKESEAHWARIHDGYPPSTAGNAVAPMRARLRRALAKFGGAK